MQKSKLIHPLFDLSGKTAIVTGGGSGLGREFCEVLAEFGAGVACVDLYPDRADETVEIIKKYGGKSLSIAADVARYEQVQAAFTQVMAEFGRLDILVNNAGIAPPSVLIDQTELSDWHKVIDVDLHGVFYCLKEGLGIMRKQKSGVIINVASNLGVSAYPPEILAQSPYVAAKHAVIGLTREAAAEYGQFGIRVNCLAPGFHRGTRLPESLGIKRDTKESEARDLLIKSRTPLGRTGEPGELKSLLLCLASDSTSFTTGAIIVSDGGWVVW
jgi:NAD(P)-dependent dehydrogenase (short-subunit alcohol dehydrogenase family)